VTRKYEIKQHIPNWADIEPGSGEFSTLEELLAVPFVASWKEAPNFLRYSKSKNMLMVELAPTKSEPDGSHWVLGYLSDPQAVDLPQWVTRG
jgi:hypothetical protein